MRERLLSTEGLICILAIIWLFNSCILKVKYTSLNSIFKNYLGCFKNEKEKFLIIPIVNYIILPIVLALIVARKRVIDPDIIETLTIIISILTAMLFTLLTMLIEMKAKIKGDPSYYSIEAETSKKALIETYYIVMFEITMSVFVLIMCLINAFTKYFNVLQSFLIYACSFVIICNLLVIIKRIFKVIDTSMNK
ncbi:hypothetical protein AAAU22_07550 [[Clostridium] symbiosum]|uniref:hypothetical protein n=1 Tax=Clostridium symbiosum TaxID=1512 RepID=UPI0032BF84C0